MDGLDWVGFFFFSWTKSGSFGFCTLTFFLLKDVKAFRAGEGIVRYLSNAVVFCSCWWSQ